MKANEAPERIYLPIDDSLETYARKDSDEEIEYIRTDAFIEKAIKYIANHFLALGMDNEIEGFRKYMEGE